MTTQNAYATLAEFKDYWRSRGGEIRADASDDTVIEFLLRAASRLIDSETGRHFYPYYETRYYSVPDGDSLDVRLLKLDNDLLEVDTVTNGDGTVIPSTEYKLVPKNNTPHSGVRLNGTSTYYWTSDASGDTESVISIAGFWGYHNRYSDAWESTTTANEAMDASETDYTVTTHVGFSVGDLIRFDNEMGYVSSIDTNILTILRGVNGTTAATHLTGISISIWKIMDECRNACIEIANAAYNRRFGVSTNNTETITASGIVLSPRDIPPLAADFIRAYRRYV